jgi:hypothetical protein
MGIEFQNNQAIFTAVASVEDAEILLEWLQKNPTATVNLSLCSHVHTANLQVLIAADITVKEWPEDIVLRHWIEPLFPVGVADDIDKNQIEPGEIS